MKDVEVAVTRPIEEAVSIVLGVIRVRSKSVRGAAEIVDRLRARHRHDPGAQRHPRADGRIGSQLPAGTTTIIERQTPSVFPIISFVVTGGNDPAALHDYAYYDLRPRISRHSRRLVRDGAGGRHPRNSGRSGTEALVAAGLSIADVADRLGKEHRLKAVGRLDRDVLQYQVLADTLAVDPLELEDRVIVQKNGQSIRLRDLGRVVISHEDRTMAIRSNGEDAVALTVFRRLGGNALEVSRDLEACWPMPRSRPAGRDRSAGLRPGAAGHDSDRQRPRRDRHRRLVQRADPAHVPQEPAGDRSSPRFPFR